MGDVAGDDEAKVGRGDQKGGDVDAQHDNAW